MEEYVAWWLAEPLEESKAKSVDSTKVFNKFDLLDVELLVTSTRVGDPN